MPASAKNRKTFKQDILVDQWPDFEIIPQECLLDDPVQKLLKSFCSTEQNILAARSKNRKNFNRHVLLSQLPDFIIISQECSLGRHLPKLLKSFCSAITKWAPELKIEKPLYDIYS